MLKFSTLNNFYVVIYDNQRKTELYPKILLIPQNQYILKKWMKKWKHIHLKEIL